MEQKTPDPIDELDELEAQNEAEFARVSLEAARCGRTGYTLALFEPIMVGAERRESLTFRTTTIGDVRKNKSDDFLLAADLAGVSPPETLGQLSDIDYRRVLHVLRGFRLRRVAGGPALKI